MRKLTFLLCLSVSLATYGQQVDSAINNMIATKIASNNTTVALFLTAVQDSFISLKTQMANEYATYAANLAAQQTSFNSVISVLKDSISALRQGITVVASNTGLTIGIAADTAYTTGMISRALAAFGSTLDSFSVHTITTTDTVPTYDTVSIPVNTQAFFLVNTSQSEPATEDVGGCPFKFMQIRNVNGVYTLFNQQTIGTCAGSGLLSGISLSILLSAGKTPVPVVKLVGLHKTTVLWNLFYESRISKL